MTDNGGGAPPKKRSFFKRAAWQDDEPKADGDMFSHADEFKHIVADQQRRDEEQKKKAEEERKRKQEAQREKKRRKLSSETMSPPPTAGSESSKHASQTESPKRSRTPTSRGLSYSAPNSLAARYDTITRNGVASNKSYKEAPVIDLGDSDEDDVRPYQLRSANPGMTTEYAPPQNDYRHDISMRGSKPILLDGDDDPEEVLDPTLAALVAKARQSNTTSKSGTQEKAPVAQLFIHPMMEGANPLLVKVRIDSTLEKTKSAWCEKQGFSPEMQQGIFFTWNKKPVYDSTTVKRLGIKVDAHGLVSVEGDSNIYDDVNLPKVAVEAWTEEAWAQWKKEEAAEAAARKKAAEPIPHEPPREPTPEPTPQAKKFRLILKARGKEDYKLSVNPHTTFGHIAAAYKNARKIDESQPVTLMFDGDRLAPMDTIEDSEVEDLDSIEVLFK